MTYGRYDKNRIWKQGNLAAILVDYDNLHTYLTRHSRSSNAIPDELIAELLDEVRRYLYGRDYKQPAFFHAYADFSTLEGDGLYIQQSLARQGQVPRFVSTGNDPNAPELQLFVDALELLFTRSDIQTFVLVTGDRIPLPLIQKLKEYGRIVLVVAFDVAATLDQFPYLDHEMFLSAYDYLSEPSQQILEENIGGSNVVRNGSWSRKKTGKEESEERKVSHESITDTNAIQTLEIIEEHFGQYDEVYLTPLLRKLSEVFDDQEHDPKSIINILEDAGAVWLEKRRGFPYDYTVLLIDNDHPDVVSAREKAQQNVDRSRSDQAYQSADFEEEDLYEDRLGADYPEARPEDFDDRM